MHAQTALATLYAEGKVVARDNMAAEAYYKKAALKGDSVAQWMLGVLFYEGRSRRGRDLEEAFKWFNASAAQGNSKAQVSLGLMYEYGLTMPAPRFDKALQLYTDASLNGDIQAQFYLGVMYLHGRGVLQDLEYGARLIQSSATNGFAPAMDTLAKLYTYGQGMDIDYEAALDWFTRAAQSGDPVVATRSQKAKAELEAKMEEARNAILNKLRELNAF